MKEKPAKDRAPRQSLWRLALSISLFAAALLSVAYSVATARHAGGDLLAFRDGARDWLVGAYTLNEGSIAGYPPFTAPLLTPLALISFGKLVLIWLGLNVVATVVIILLATRLFGVGWRIHHSLYLAAFFVAWAPFRVTLRVGQISLLITALLLAALLARQSKKHFMSGILLALSLSKYTLTFPFLLYFVWRQNWKIVLMAVVIVALLTEIFSLRLGLPLTTVLKDYVHLIRTVQGAAVEGFMGTTEIKMLLFNVTGGNDWLTSILTTALVVAALVAMIVVFRRTPKSENTHFAIMSLFALWTSYHRTYDAVLCVLPAALFVDFLRREKFKTLSSIGLAALGLLIVSPPGVLTARLGLDASRLAHNPFGFLGLHSERLMVFGLFWSLLVLLWNADPTELAHINSDQRYLES